jgi:hypothetical protein
MAEPITSFKFTFTVPKEPSDEDATKLKLEAETSSEAAHALFGISNNANHSNVTSMVTPEEPSVRDVTHGLSGGKTPAASSPVPTDSEITNGFHAVRPTHPRELNFTHTSHSKPVLEFSTPCKRYSLRKYAWSSNMT